MLKNCLKLFSTVFLIHASSMQIYVMSRVQLAGHPSCAGKTYNVGHANSFLPNFFIPAMLIGAIDFSHFIPLSFMMTLPGAHKVSAKQNLHFSIDQDEI